MTRDMALLILGATPSATEEEIKKCFAAKAALWHPDKHGNDPSKTEMMRQIIEARDVALGRARASPNEASASRAEVEEEPEDYEPDYDEVMYSAEFLASVGVDGFMGGSRLHRCKGKTKDGRGCTSKAQPGNYGYCYRHR